MALATHLLLRLLLDLKGSQIPEFLVFNWQLFAVTNACDW